MIYAGQQATKRDGMQIAYRDGNTSVWMALAACAVAVAVCIHAQTTKAQEPTGIAAAEALEQTLVQAIATTEKSVVAVARVRRDLPTDAIRAESLPDPFNLRSPQGRALNPADPSFVPNEYGAGVIVDRRGLIVTSYSVMGDDSDYYITTSDRHVYKAWIKAADPRSDLAVLGIDGADAASANLVPIRLGDAASLRKGQIVITLGNPHAIAHDGQASAAWGIVANMARKPPGDTDDADPTAKRSLHHFGTLIQTDIHLHEGSGGGPLVNLRGEMVGLCAILGNAPGCETSQGLAIPVDKTFRRALEVLKQGREVEYGFLGIRPINLATQQLTAGLHGTRVEAIVPGTPAARFGLRGSDIITAVNGKPIYDADGLVLEVGRLPVEATARLAVLRNGSKVDVDVTLSKYPVRGKKVVTVRDDAWRGLRVDYPSCRCWKMKLCAQQ